MSNLTKGAFGRIHTTKACYGDGGPCTHGPTGRLEYSFTEKVSQSFCQSEFGLASRLIPLFPQTLNFCHLVALNVGSPNSHIQGLGQRQSLAEWAQASLPEWWWGRPQYSNFRIILVCLDTALILSNAGRGCTLCMMTLPTRMRFSVS